MGESAAPPQSAGPRANGDRLAAAGRVTSADVARRAGVSRATVSYVLNDRAGHAIREETRRRVRAAAAELGYVPNHSARTLRGKTPPLILFVTRGLPFGRNIGDIGDGLMAAAAEAGFSVVTWRWGSTEALERTLAHLAPRLVLTIVPLGDRDTDVIARLGIPLVDSWATSAERFGGSHVARMQVARLADGGRRRIAYLGAREDALGLFEVPRRDGVRAACAERGLPAPEVAAVPMPHEQDLERVAEIVGDWHRRGVQAIACYNDFWAAAVLRATRILGLAVPGDLAVIGVDDEPFSAFTDPPLTTVTLEPAAFGAELFAGVSARVGAADRAVGTTADAAPEPRAQIHLVPRASA